MDLSKLTEPRFGMVLGFCIFTWINTVLGVLVAYGQRDWFALIWASNAGICAAGWVQAVRGWKRANDAVRQMASE